MVMDAGTQPPAVPVAALESFIFAPDQFTKDDVPLGLDPTVIAEFVTHRLTRAAPLAAFEQTRKLVDFYDVYEVAPYFVELLNRPEDKEDLARTTEMALLVAIVGQPPELEFARRYFPRLAERATTLLLFERLAALLEALGPGADPTPLQRGLDARLQGVRSRAAGDPAAAQETQALERLLTFTLPRISKANAVKQRILAIPQRNARIDEEVRTYLGLKYGFGEYLPLWAARRLRRETWATEPPQQTVRSVDPERRHEVVEGFRRVLVSIGTLQDAADDEKLFYQVNGLQAIRFFEGELTPVERELVRKHQDEQKAYLRPAHRAQ
jgi:hypothetical protein